MPTIPEMHKIPEIPLNNALSLILVSVALEEIGLSHIINAEGEKIQAIVHAVDCGKADPKELFAIDRNVNNVLRTIVKKEILLELKMVEALEAFRFEGPPPCTPTYR
ncbi:MAG: hypothetical protein P4N59_07630 [Negativicutes bacterium]|nr:hypothetical protein [Negativicutes bacterium]